MPHDKARAAGFDDVAFILADPIEQGLIEFYQRLGLKRGDFEVKIGAFVSEHSEEAGEHIAFLFDPEMEGNIAFYVDERIKSLLESYILSECERHAGLKAQRTNTRIVAENIEKVPLGGYRRCVSAFIEPKGMHSGPR